MRKGIWKKGKKTLEGWWSYNRGSDTFSITIKLKRRDSITGESERRFVTHNDTPEFNGWKLQQESR